MIDKKDLTERMNFTWKRKFYYNFIREYISDEIKRTIQKIYGKEIDYFKNFIDFEGFIDIKQFNISREFFQNKLYNEKLKFAIMLTHDVENFRGFEFIPEIIKLEKKYGFRSSWNLVPYKYPINDQVINYIRNSDGEIGIHGYSHDGRLYYNQVIFLSRVPKINEALKSYNAIGFRSPMVHRNLRWLQELDIEYDMSCFDYDPFQPFPGGTGFIWPFIAGKFVELPYTLPQDHTLFYVLKVKNIDIWKKKVDWLIENNGVILVLTHPDYLMEKDNLKYYEELLVYLNELKGGWRCLPREMARRVRDIEDYPLRIDI